jgi:penicillin V acylase-like amidase (Ntn superfamily)
MFRIALMFCIMATLGSAQAAQACTTFQLQRDGEVYFGRNYDWMISDALVIINKRGVKKPGMPHPKDQGLPAEWISKYGSLTFNQYGRETPTGGMNEAGLVVECMYLPGTQMPDPDGRPYLAMPGLWRQYILDNFATVDEALAGIKGVRMCSLPGPSGPHHLISDAGGGCAVVEFLDGKMVVYEGADLPYRALSNTSYAECLGTTGQNPFRVESLVRFKIAAKMATEYGPATKMEPIDYAFTVLGEVAFFNNQWQIVYDQTNRAAYFRTRGNPKLRWVDLSKMDFSCRVPVMILDINADLKGDVTENFTPYNLAANRDLVVGSYGKTPFLRQTPKLVLAYISFFPEKCKCVGP